MNASGLGWRDDLLVSFAEMDRQHIKIVALAGEFHAAIVAQKPKPYLERTLNALIESTRKHFTSEEGMMLASGYPGYDEHRAQHERLLQQFGNLKADLAEGYATASRGLATLVQVLTEQHILFSDKHLAAFLNENGFAAP